MKTQYEEDFAAWAFRNADLLRTGSLGEADIENIAEEIESLGCVQASELSSRVGVILEHLLKLRLARGIVLDYNKRSWELTKIRQRLEIMTLLKNSPSLRKRLTPALLTDRYSGARSLVAIQFDVEPPVECPFSWEEILGQ